MAVLLKTDGTRKQIQGQGVNGSFTLEQLQQAVGGYIEAVPGTDHRVWCNEDGRQQQLPMNPVASFTYNQVLVGDVLVMELKDTYESDEKEGREA